MALIVAVHGIGQQFKGERTIHGEWLPSLQDGMNRAGVPPLASNDLACAFYGDLFRPRGTKSVQPTSLNAGDVSDPNERALLALWSSEAVHLMKAPQPTAVGSKARTPGWVQSALNTLSRSPFFARVSESLLIMDLKQVRSYMNDPETRRAARTRVERTVTADTRILMGHSLGSVVAYETLCSHPEWPITTLITFGSPLGISNLIFDRLEPPARNGLGRWPECARTWVNISDEGDIVALVKHLNPIFERHVEDRLVNNGATAHNASPYLTAVETGAAIASGLQLT
jgi:hypothetical protein